jgi:hypothetical protein
MPRISAAKRAAREEAEQREVVVTVEKANTSLAELKAKDSAPRPTSTQSSSTHPYEDRRKEMQRTLQKLVLEMRKEGRSEADIKYAITREKRKEEKKILALEEKRANEQKANSHDVIIVPVAWKRHHQEKVDVDVTCDNVRRALFSTGLSPWLDCRREYSPGQKFAYWEHMGVKFRIEIGPEDISQGICRVVRADKPGAYLEHRREKPELNLQSIIRTLADFGLTKCQSMNSDLMSDVSLIERSLDREDINDATFDQDDVGGNVHIPDRQKAQSNKKFRRF